MTLQVLWRGQCDKLPEQVNEELDPGPKVVSGRHDRMMRSTAMLTYPRLKLFSAAFTVNAQPNMEMHRRRHIGLHISCVQISSWCANLRHQRSQ